MTLLVQMLYHSVSYGRLVGAKGIKLGTCDKQTSCGNISILQKYVSDLLHTNCYTLLLKLQNSSASSTPSSSPKKNDSQGVTVPELPATESGLLSLPTAAMYLLREVNDQSFLYFKYLTYLSNETKKYRLFTGLQSEFRPVT